MNEGWIELSSDTATQPSAAMRHAMAYAPVGDEQRGEDPTVNALEAKAAEILGKEAAMFLPSATMANQIAIHIATRPGDEIICHELSHIRLYEGGGPAALSGCLLYPLPGARGILTGAQITAAYRVDDNHAPHSRLVSIEDTHNAAGGTIWKVSEHEEVARAARAVGLDVHLDGSRIMNAAVASGVPAAAIAAPYDTVTLCLSKGLGAPVGAILAGDRERMRVARRWKHVFGGAMRQVGIIAAAGLYALEHNVERLAEDHANAARLAEGLAAIPGVVLDPAPETNIVFVEVKGTGYDGAQARARLLDEGIRSSGPRGTRVRFVTHLDITRDDIDRAISVARRALAGGR